jgi:hypothetical protein
MRPAYMPRFPHVERYEIGPKRSAFVGRTRFFAAGALEGEPERRPQKTRPAYMPRFRHVERYEIGPKRSGLALPTRRTSRSDRSAAHWCFRHIERHEIGPKRSAFVGRTRSLRPALLTVSQSAGRKKTRPAYMPRFRHFADLSDPA